MIIAGIDYGKLVFRHQQHHIRYRRFIEAMPKKLICQECGGSGGEVDVILDDGTGPWEECGYCEGTGFLTPHMRSVWLNDRRIEARKKQSTADNERR